MTDCLANWVNERITNWLNEWMTDKLCVVVQQKCKALSNISQSKTLWFLQLAATLATFFFCGVARWGMWGVCVVWCVVCMTSQLAMSVYLDTPFNQTWHTQIRKQTRQDDFGRIASSAARQMSLQMTNADNRHWFKQSPAISHISLTCPTPHLTHHPPYTPSPLPPSVNQLSVLSNLPAACLQPSNYSAQPFGSSPLICPTLPSMHACNPAYPDNWWAASTTLCAFHFSLFALLSLCLCFLRFCLKGAKSLGMQRPKESRVSLDPVSLLCGLFGSVSFTFVQFRFVHL